MYISNQVEYYLYGNECIIDPHDLHSITHCTHLEELPNVHVIKKKETNVKIMRDNGEMRQLFDKLVYIPIQT